LYTVVQEYRDLGSYEWGYDDFGQKILKAMEFQGKGKDVKILNTAK